jgi:hypothetical protein
MTIQFWRLSEAGKSNLGLACTADGLLLGRTPLIARRGERFVVREQRDIERLFSRAYHDASAVERIMSGLGTVAAALNADDQCLACIAAVHLRIPDLPDFSARERMEAEDALIKYARGEEPEPEWDPAKHPRTGTPPNPGWFAPTDGEDSESSPVHTAENDDPNRRTDVPPIPHDDWVHLRPGPKRIDELADFVEWIANARPEDEQAIRAEIKRYFCDVGDRGSCDALNAHLTALLKPGVTPEDRQRILNLMDAYTRADPAEWVHVRDWGTAAAVTIGGVPPASAAGRAAAEAREAEPAAAEGRAAETATAPPSASFDPWKLGWGTRGDYFSEALGANLPRNFPVIDGWENGIATSIKSIDLNAATYQNGMGLTYRLNKYIDSLAGFEGDTMGDIVIRNSDISGRVLDIAVPKGSMTAVQKTAIDAASKRAETLGIKLVITEF